MAEKRERTDGMPTVMMTHHLGRVWVGCEHGTPNSGPPLYCRECFYDCLRAYLETVPGLRKKNDPIASTFRFEWDDDKWEAMNAEESSDE